MEYIYAALLLHSAKKEITEEAISEVMKASGIEVDPVRVKALVSALEGVDIEEAISKQVAMAPAPAAVTAAAQPEEAAEEQPAEEEKAEEEEEEAEESGIEGLGALFG
ncbi:50S ribosomal protein P1 [Methermicoccus shengliensis]|uniref:Large ribosomal subunit protein P1 n=1 Tax=Methermicoccus shengliensis TaxID=660064 RepID=A0A832RY01_9EURY|nr:50S ribosomal protein P1 [Methermicoccus shengliensis]HIH69471.1 50S ribosomal protein P1 [Methermicoccus shengliensis]